MSDITIILINYNGQLFDTFCQSPLLVSPSNHPKPPCRPTSPNQDHSTHLFPSQSALSASLLLTSSSTLTLGQIVWPAFCQCLRLLVSPSVTWPALCLLSLNLLLPVSRDSCPIQKLDCARQHGSLIVVSLDSWTLSIKFWELVLFLGMLSHPLRLHKCVHLIVFFFANLFKWQKYRMSTD